MELYYHISVGTLVWLLHNLTLDCELCLRDDRNHAIVYVHRLLPLSSSMDYVTHKAISGRLSLIS